MEPHYGPPSMGYSSIVQPPADLLQVKREQQHEDVLALERLLRAQAAIASDRAANPIIPPNRPDEAVLLYARELAKRLAREDHQAEIAARQASDPATTKSP